PVVMCLLPFVWGGGLHAVYEDIFVVPQLRFEFVAAPLPGLVTVLAVLPYAAILAWGAFRRMPGEAVATAISATVLLALLYACREPEVYRLVWYSVRPLVPVLTLVGCLSLVRAARWGDQSADTRLALLLLVGMAAMVSLVQFPYPFGIYFCYAAPLVALGL